MNFLAVRGARACPADDSSETWSFYDVTIDVHSMWQWLEPHDLYWRRVSSKMHSHLHTKDNIGKCPGSLSAVVRPSFFDRAFSSPLCASKDALR